MKIKKSMKTLPLLLAAAMALPASITFAQDDKAPAAEKSCPVGGKCKSCKGGADKFAEIDADSDGKVTESELVAMHQKRVAEFAKKHFERMDIDENGSVTATEMSLVSRQYSARGKHHRGGRSHGKRGGCKGGSCEGGKCGSDKKSGKQVKPETVDKAVDAAEVD